MIQQVLLRAVSGSLALSLSLGATGAAAAPARLTAPVTRRFLSSYGFAHALRGDHVLLPDGTRRALAEVRTQAQLLELTGRLERRPFAGLLGLRSDKGVMKVLLENMARASAALAKEPNAQRMNALLSEGKIEHAHDLAVSELVFGEGPLDKRLNAVARAYMSIGSARAAQLLQRKLTRLDGGEIAAQLLAARIALSRDQQGKLRTILTALVDKYGERPEVLRGAAEYISSSGMDPAWALTLARKALALDPKAAVSHTILGLVSLSAGLNDKYDDEDGKRTTREVAITRGLALLRHGEALGAGTPHASYASFTLPSQANAGPRKQLLSRAVTHYERGELDDAERVAREVLTLDGGEALAHRLVELVRGARRKHAETVLMKDEVRRPVIETVEQQHQLVARAEQHGIDRLIPGYAQLRTERKAIIARGLLPWAWHWPQMIGKQSELTLVGLGESITEVKDALVKYDAKTFDGRYWYGTRGIAAMTKHKSHTGIEAVDAVRKGTGRDTVAHEFTHLVHGTLPKVLCDRLTALYQSALAEGRILDAYSRQNEREYFARGFELWLSHQGAFATQKVRPDPPELLKKDRALYDFLTEITGGAGA